MPCQMEKSKNYKVSNSTKIHPNFKSSLNNGNLTFKLFIFYVHATTINISQRVFNGSDE